MSRRSYAGGARQALLDGAITSSSNVISCDSLDGWPTGTEGPGPFYALIDKGVEGSEEKVLCTSRTGNTLNITTRGADGTTATSHSLGATIEHVHVAVDSDEANDHVNTAQGVHGLDPSDPVVGQSTSATLTNKTIDTSVNSITVDQEDVTGLVAGQAAQDAATALVQTNLDAEEAARISADSTLQGNIDTEEAARIAADAAHEAAGDPHPQYLTPAEGDAAYVNITGDTMTGQLKAVGDPVAAEDMVRKAYVDALHALPAPDMDFKHVGTTYYATANGTWTDVPAAAQCTVSVNMPKAGYARVDWGAWFGCIAPLSGSFYWALGIRGSGVTTLDEVEGTWGDVPRVTNRPGNSVADGTVNSSRLVYLNAGNTVIRLRCIRVWSTGSPQGNDTYMAYTKLRVTPERFA